jgi:hypothetical protein
MTQGEEFLAGINDTNEAMPLINDTYLTGIDDTGKACLTVVVDIGQ